MQFSHTQTYTGLETIKGQMSQVVGRIAAPHHKDRLPSFEKGPMQM